MWRFLTPCKLHPTSYKWHDALPTFMFAGFGNIAASRCVDEYPAEENASKFTDNTSYSDKQHENIGDKNYLRIIKNSSNSEVSDLYSQLFHTSADLSTFLRDCGGIKVAPHFVQQIHAKIVHWGLSTSALICNSIIHLYLMNESVDSAVQIFRNMSRRESVAWVAILSSLSNNFQELEAILLYCEMRRLGVFPTPYVFSSIISASTKIEYYEVGEQLHAVIYKWGYSAELFVCNSLLTLYSRRGYLRSAEQMFREMPRKDRVSYNTLISGFSMLGSNERSLELFKKMNMECLRPDSVTVACLLSTCASMVVLVKGIQLHSYAIKSGISSDIIIEGSILDLYVKCSDIKAAHKFFLTARKDNVVLWNVMLTAYGQIGDLHESGILNLESKYTHKL